jgi:hypothetical protein
MRNAFWSVSAGQAKIDRGYDDYVERRISDALRARESAEWETELASVTANSARLSGRRSSFAVARGRRSQMASGDAAPGSGHSIRLASMGVRVDTVSRCVLHASGAST